MLCVPTASGTRGSSSSNFLANEEIATAVAKKVGVSSGRIGQIHKELCAAWRWFQGDEPVVAIA